MGKAEITTSQAKLTQTSEFDDKVHKLGISTTIIMWIFFLAVPLGITVIFNLDFNIL